jgi:ABC-type spermidine/putrescine transport system permease subunit II
MSIASVYSFFVNMSRSNKINLIIWTCIVFALPIYYVVITATEPKDDT